MLRVMAMESVRVDVEWEALLQGVKPAVRRTIDPAQADAAVARWRAQGVAVVSAAALSPMGGREVAVLYLARSLADAEALRDAEAPVLPGSPTYLAGGGVAVVRRHREVGRALGFPACCVEAFCARLARGVDVLGGARGLAEDYVAAREAWVPRGDARLNALLVRARLQIVSFYACRYDCPWAIAHAEALLGAVSKRHGADVARALVDALAQVVVLDSRGARAVVRVEGARIVSARAGSADDPRDERLAVGLVGARVAEDGAVGEGELAPWAFTFVA